MLVTASINTEKALFTNYAERLTSTIESIGWASVIELAQAMLQ